MFSKYRVTSKYGWRIHPISKVRKFHGGIDLVLAHKARIHAFTGGKVTHARMNHQGFGNLVIVTEPNGYRHFYAHLHTILVRQGQQVSKGSTIGLQGATGNVTGSHLHYEVRNPQNKTVNPTQYIQQKKGSKRMVKKIAVDGYRGKETILRWQQFLGTYQDGVISRPSNMMRAWQQFLNKYGKKKIKVDGYEGKETIEASQLFFGTHVDGVISRPSNYIKALQRFLNTYGQ